MLDFSCEYKSKQNTFQFDKNLNLKVNGIKANYYDIHYSAQEAKGLVETLRNAILVKNKVNIDKLKFEEVIYCVKLIEKSKVMLCDIRLSNIFQYKSRNKFKYEIIDSINNQFYSGETQWGSSREGKQLSVPQRFVIRELSNDNLFNYVSTWDFTDLYNCVKNDTSKINSYYKELTSFPYGKYGADKKFTLIQITLKKEKALSIIKAFNFIKNQAGTDLVNWSPQKVTRRLNNNGYASHGYYSISHWITEQIKANGKKEIVKEKKLNSIQKIQEKIKKDIELTQAELICVFKNGYTDQFAWALNRMDYDSLKELMESNLKAVNKKLHPFNLSFQDKKTDNQMKNFSRRASNVFEGDKKEFRSLFEYVIAHESGLGNLTWDFLYKHKQWVPSKDIVEFAKINSCLPDDWADAIPNDLWTTHFSELDHRTIMNISNLVTKEFVRRLPNELKITILPILTKKRVNVLENSMHFMLDDYHQDWDFEDSLFNTEHFNGLYNNVEWEVIREAVLKDKNLMLEAIDLILTNEDKEIARKMLVQYSGSFYYDNKAHKLLNLFDLKNKTDIVLKATEITKSFSNHYDDVIQKAFPKKEDLEYLFKEILKDNNHAYTNKIFSIFECKKFNFETLNSELLNCSCGLGFPINEITVNHLTKEVRLHLSKQFSNLSSDRRPDINEAYAKFYKGFTKQDVLDTIGENFIHRTDNIYFLNVMTKEEKILACEKDSNFLRVHFKKMPYDYLRKYKDKTKLKDLVGDCRDRNNKYFKELAEGVLSQIEDKNSLDFMCE